jgi:hypothetical protein
MVGWCGYLNISTFFIKKSDYYLKQKIKCAINGISWEIKEIV